MKSAKLHTQESERLSALDSLQLLDTLPEKEFDEITLLASKICNTPIALFSLVDKNRQWFKSRQGLSAEETPREIAFCSHAILQNEMLYVPDVKNDKRFFDNPLVTNPPLIEFYAGVPILDPNSKLPIGTLCVIDTVPRELTPDQLACLEALKNQIHRLLVLRVQLQWRTTVEKKLTEHGQRVEFILEGAGLGSWDWWLQTNEVHFDRRWCEMLGLNHEETLHDLSTWDSRVHSNDREKAYSDIKSYLDGKTPLYENIHRLRHENGQWVWILDRGKISERDENGKPIRFTGTHFDVTKQVTSEKRLSEAQEIAKIGSWHFDLRTKHQSWSTEHYRIFEIEEPQSQESLYQLYRDRIHPEDLPELDRLIERAAKEGLGFIYNHRVLLDNGKRTKHVQGIGKVTKDSAGVPLDVSGTCQDITEKVEAEQKLEQKRLEAIQVSKMATLGEMSAGVAHEINNPLAIIKGNVTLIKKHKMDDGKFENRLDSIARSVERIAKIVNGLRKFSRTSDPFNMASHSIKTIIQDAITLIETRSKRYSTELKIDLQSSANILCDPIEIEQVVVNLVNNGIDAVQEQPAEQRWVTIKSFNQEKEVVLQVIDSGFGLPEELVQKVFQPFFTTKPIGEGTGLGLSVSKGILDNHKAKFKINREFKNTCFEIRFEISEAGQNES